jgi:hypothetical protein
MKEKMNIGIEELFMAKAGKNGWDKCFYGIIRRGDGIVHGKIKIGDGYIVASAKDQWELGEKLDELVLVNLIMK